MKLAAPLVAGALFVLSGCSSSLSPGTRPAETLPASAVRPAHRAALPFVDHIVVIIQENRTVDNLFGGPTPFCPSSSGCVQTVAIDPATGTTLQPVMLGAGHYDPSHTHEQFVTQFDNGAMDGFPRSTTDCGHGPCSGPYTVFSYVPQSETPQYRNLAILDGAVSDMTFEPNEGPSFPAHHYAIAGQAGGYDSDRMSFAENPAKGDASCFAERTAVVGEMDMRLQFPGVESKGYPCKDFQTIFDLLAPRGLSWRYYASGTDPLWTPTQAIAHLDSSPNLVTPETRILSDISARRLANVSFVTPDKMNSDHPSNVGPYDPSGGPKWVSSIVNAIGQSPYWYSTAIVVYWDDWGGWYDHVRPPAAPFTADPYEYGFRVPLFVVSPYAKVGYVDHTPRTFVSVLRLIESTFSLPSLNTLDALEPDGLDPMFDVSHPHGFVPIGANLAKP